MSWRYTGHIYKGKGYPSLQYGTDENNLVKSPEGEWGRISFVDEDGNRAYLEFTDMTVGEFINRITGSTSTPTLHDSIWPRFNLDRHPMTAIGDKNDD